MHELSVMSQVVESVARELEGKHIIKVESVRLEIGELTMLGKEQLKFAWGILTEDGPLKGSKLIVVKKPAVIECIKCGYCGGAKHPTGLGSHLVVPYIACPKCAGEVKVVGGRECIIRSLKATMNDHRLKPVVSIRSETLRCHRLKAVVSSRMKGKMGETPKKGGKKRAPH